MRLPSPTDVEVGVAAALSSQVVVYLIIESTCVTARRLVTQVDSMIKYTTTCEDSAAATPTSTSVGLGKRMKSYDAALRDFRVAIGLPVKDDTTKATKRP